MTLQRGSAKGSAKDSVKDTAKDSAKDTAMSFRVSGKNLDIGEALRERINDRIAETLDKYFDGGYSGHATLAKDGLGSAPNAPSTSIPKSCCMPKAMAADAYAQRRSGDHQLEKQLRRYHRRLKDHRAEAH